MRNEATAGGMVTVITNHTRGMTAATATTAVMMIADHAV